jgi:hypothetical protein
MTQRSILAGQLPILVHAGTNVEVEGWDGDRVQAETDSRWGLQLERRSETEFGRIRAQVGDFTLLDVGLDKDVINGLRNVAHSEVIDVKVHSDAKVWVPRNSILKIYAGKSVTAHHLQGPVDIFAGGSVTVSDLNLIGQVSAGRNIDLTCSELTPGPLKFTAGRDLRFNVATLQDVHLAIHDLGGKWEAAIGSGANRVHLKAGGDVTLVTDQELTAQAPHYLLGKIEKRTVGA